MVALNDAIRRLRPGVNFGNTDNTLNGIRWDAPLPEGFVPPTQAEVDAAVASMAVPTKILNWKGRAILVQRGLHAGVTAALAAIADPTQRAMAQIAFESADFTRDSPLLNAVLSGLGLDEAAKDALFVDGDALTL